MSEIEKSFTTEKYVVSYPVEPEHDGWRLDQFVQKCMPTLSRQFLKRKIEKGEVEISGRKSPHKSSVKVHFGERVTITTHNDGKMEEELWYGKPVLKDQDPTIVFEDKDLLVINKPPYMITHPAGRNLFYCATVFFETIYKHTIHSIHRLDRETSGLLLLGKNPKVSQKVSQLFEDDKVRKCYFLIAHKKDDSTPFPFTAKERMDRDENNIPPTMMSHWSHDSRFGKDAETVFELLLEKDGYVLALAFPLTGRQHQIRVHAAAHGYPLLGEKLYNGDPGIFMRFKDFVPTEDDHVKLEIPRQALHAVALKIAYPLSEMKHFIAPLPKDLSDWMSLKLGLSHAEVETLIHAKVSKLI
ncbi:MAG TPA: RluA family pseudouridine synthase [Bacteriovoracaceae bacterium]|nr:RluA family pseudouridine synthase [Bacteriovoracaceae bacterium]